MPNVYTFVAISLGIMVMLNLAGISTSEGYALQQLGLMKTTTSLQGLDISASNALAQSQQLTSNKTLFFTALGIVLAMLFVSGAGIKVGFFGLYPNQYPAGVLMTVLLSFFSADFFAVLQQAVNLNDSFSFLSYFVVALMGIFIIMFAASLYGYARGTE